MEILDLKSAKVWDAGSPQEDANRYDVRALPPQDIPEKDKTPTWWIRNARYIASYYNRPYIPSANAYQTYLQSGPTSQIAGDGSNDQSQRYVYPVTEMLNNIQYYHGRQPNVRYNYIVKDVTTSNLQTSWVKGRKIAQLIDSFEGSIRSLVSNANFSVRTMSPKAYSERAAFLDNVVLQLDNQDFFNEMEKLGISYSPANGAKFASESEAVDFLNNGGFKDYTGDLATDIANGIWTENHWLSKSMQAFNYLQTCGVCGIEHYVENGRLYHDVIPSYQLILDLRKDEDYNRDARFVGVIRLLTPTEIFNRWPVFSKEQKEDIEKMANSSALTSIYNTMPGFNFSWWYHGGNYLTNLIACVTVYWIGRKNIGKQAYKTRFGVEKIRDVRQGEEGDHYVDAVHKLSFIGNRFMVDYGYQSNQVEDDRNKNRVRLPICVYVPKTFLGEIISPVAKVKRMQDDRDMAYYKAKEMIGDAGGKNYIIYANKGVTAKDIVEDFKSMHLTVINPETGEADDDGRRNQRLVDTVDMTLDPNMQVIMGFYDKVGTEMEEILSTSKIALGQQKTYVGYDTQQQTLSQNSLGMSYLIDGFMNYLQINMQYAINAYKYMSTSEGDIQTSLLVGDKGIKYLEITKDFAFEDLLCYLNINDLIEQAEKERILKGADLALQNGGIDMLDWTEINIAQTYSQIRKWLVKSYAKKDQKAAMQDYINKLQEQLKQSQVNQGQLAMAAVQSQAGLQKQAMADENAAKNTILQAAVDNSAGQPPPQPQQAPPMQ